MKVTVDDDFCAGHGACVVTCPEVFVIGSGGYAEVLVDQVPAALEDRVRQAERECPTAAISVEDEP